MSWCDVFEEDDTGGSSHYGFLGKSGFYSAFPHRRDRPRGSRSQGAIDRRNANRFNKLEEKRTPTASPCQQHTHAHSHAAWASSWAREPSFSQHKDSSTSSCFDPPEKRICPDDGEVYSLSELKATFSGKFSDDGLLAYWQDMMDPISQTAAGAADGEIDPLFVSDPWQQGTSAVAEQNHGGWRIFSDDEILYEGLEGDNGDVPMSADALPFVPQLFLNQRNENLHSIAACLAASSMDTISELEQQASDMRQLIEQQAELIAQQKFCLTMNCIDAGRFSCFASTAPSADLECLRADFGKLRSNVRTLADSLGDRVEESISERKPSPLFDVRADLSSMLQENIHILANDVLGQLASLSRALAIDLSDNVELASSDITGNFEHRLRKMETRLDTLTGHCCMGGEEIGLSGVSAPSLASEKPEVFVEGKPGALNEHFVEELEAIISDNRSHNDLQQHTTSNDGSQSQEQQQQHQQQSQHQHQRQQPEQQQPQQQQPIDSHEQQQQHQQQSQHQQQPTINSSTSKNHSISIN